MIQSLERYKYKLQCAILGIDTWIVVNLLQLEAWTIIKFIKEGKMTRTDGGGTFTSKKVIIVGILLENIKIGVRPGLWIMLYQVFAKHNEIINFNIKIKVTSQPMSYSHGQDAFIQFPVKVNNYFLKAHSCLLEWFFSGHSFHWMGGLVSMQCELWHGCSIAYTNLWRRLLKNKCSWFIWNRGLWWWRLPW